MIEQAIFTGGVPTSRQVAAIMGHLNVVEDGPCSVPEHGLRQKCQWRRRLDDLARRDHVIKDPSGLGLLPQDLEHRHRLSAIQRRILQQDMRFRGVLLPRCDVQVIPGREGHPT